MSTKYGAFIKALRIKKGLSQAIVAEKIGLSRQSYMGIESEAREMTLKEAEVLCELFGISIDELSKKSEPQYEKYKQMILAYLRSDPDSRGRVPKTKLAKLLYLADFGWYYDHLESMSGMPYRRIEFGPVPDHYFRALDELFDTGQVKIEPVEEYLFVSLAAGAAKPDTGLLSDEELSLINKIANKWRDKRATEIVKFTHDQLPYKLCGDNEIIPYELITQEDPDHVY